VRKAGDCVGAIVRRGTKEEEAGAGEFLEGMVETLGNSLGSPWKGTRLKKTLGRDRAKKYVTMKAGG